MAAVVGGAIILAGLAFVACFVWLIQNVAGARHCGYELQQQALSPDRAVRAAVVEVDCGATTTWVDWVVRAPASRSFNYDKDVVVSIDSREVKIAWAGRKLLIFVPAAELSRVSKEVHADVEYRSLEAGPGEEQAIQPR